MEGEILITNEQIKAYQKNIVELDRYTYTCVASDSIADSVPERQVQTCLSTKNR